MTIFLAMLLGLGLLAAPLIASATQLPLSGTASAVMVLAGTLITAVAGIALVFTRLYRKTRASEAFVRTGSGGVKVIRDGGAIVVPVLHELIAVSLNTLKLEVSREMEDALITQDKLRADIRAEFFVRVQPDQESILQASRSLGERMSDPRAVKALVEDKLVSALRTAAAGKTLEQLNSERDEFLAEVTKLVGEDLRSNGLILETATISRLDQTDERFLKEENIFDAQGRRKIAEITQVNLTERNRLLRLGEEERRRQDVMTQQKVLELSRAEKEATFKQQAEIAKIEAEASREANIKAVEAARQVELAQVQKQEALEVAARQQQRAVEVAEREKQESIARAEKLKAAAERELAEAEAEREEALQKVQTVKVTQEAERAKRREVIEAEATAEKAFLASQREADAAAYTKQKHAEAQKAAASAEAEAIRKKAEAEAEAQRLRAEGEKAQAMVPVEVNRAQVAIERDRLETVVKPELQAREQHGRVAQDFELKKLEIEAERTVRIATAEATAQLFSKMEAKLFGTPEEVNKILSSVVQGQSWATTANAFFGEVSDETNQKLAGLTSGIGQLASAAASRLQKPESHGSRTEVAAPTSSRLPEAPPTAPQPEAAAEPAAE